MKNRILMSAVSCLLVFVACGMPTPTTDGGTGGGSGGGTATGGGSGGGTATLDFSTSAKILAYLEGKTMVMTGSDIPTSPLGFSENLNLAERTQCFNKVTIATLASNFNLTTDLGTFHANSDGGLIGMCDRTTKSNTLTFSSMTILIENVRNNGGCFDIRVGYNGFAQEGRGKISADGKTFTLELYAAATGSKCADGDVGATGVQLQTGGGPIPFSGDAKQVYRIP